VTQVDAGSFRDPDSRVFTDNGSVYRALSARGLEDFEAFAASRLFAASQQDGSVVTTTRADVAAPGVLAQGDPTAAVLEHERIPFVSYPYEWCFGMLKDAALLQLDLLDRALTEKLSLKDATPYNVQWEGTKPTFVDVGSFERLRGNEPWIGYRQFCTLYLYPLMLTAYRGVSFQPFLKGSLEGIQPADAAALLPRKKGVTINARLLARLERRQGDKTARDTNAKLAKAGFKPEIIQAQVRRLRRLVAGLEWKTSQTAWTEYDDNNRGYGEPDLEAKRAFVAGAAERVQPRLAWDLGANDGAFARHVAPHAQQVVAMDFDHETVEHMYRALKSQGPANVLPLVVDLCDPSPARGWGLAERSPLAGRGRPQLTLSLALIHHLSITRNIPVRAVLEWLRSLGGTHVIELPLRDDPMVQRLLAAKRDDEAHPDFNRAPFEAALEELFEVRDRLELTSRVLYEADAR
jgi:hypothetical protein